MDSSAGLTWHRWRDAAVLILAGRTRRPALKVAVVVGTLLTLVNQGEALVAGSVAPRAVLPICANFLIPYVVSSIGILSAYRQPPAHRRRSS